MSEIVILPPPRWAGAESHLTLPPAAMIPSLEPIPQSISATPATRESPPNVTGEGTREAIPPDALSEALGDAASGSSKRSSVASNFAMPGSYFPTSIPASTAYSASASGATTPGGRPRIEIPLATPTEPLFSSYPDQAGPSKQNSSRSKYFTLPMKSGFSLTSPRRRRANSASSDDGGVSAPPSSSDEMSSEPIIRRRSSSLTQPPTTNTISPKAPSRSLFRRRGSVSHRNAPEYSYQVPDEVWKTMASQEARRMDPERDVTFSYQQPTESDHTLQSISTIATVRPITFPTVSPRHSSLIPEPVVVIPDDLVMPHDPPPRRSSLDMTGMKDAEILDHLIHTDVPSVISSSQTGTDTSTFSPSSSYLEHPLSSATTSLSRSAKSAKEGSDERDAALTAVRLQRSLEWEAKQTKRRRRLAKRRMILLEIVETEVSYTEDLRTLVQIYLPQLAALPSVSERTAGMIARNAAELLDIHNTLVTRLIDILKEEKIDFEVKHDLEMPIERVARSLAALFVENAPAFASYKTFCAGSIAASTLVRHISTRTDYEAFERRCQFVSASRSQATLQDLLLGNTPAPMRTNRSRLRFRDFLIMPIQRICRYPLLLDQLQSTSQEELDQPESDDEALVVGTDVQAALAVMKTVAGEADEARRIKEAEIKSATILERVDPHPVITPAFLKSLGTCRLIGSLDVLHHHPLVAPLVPPVRVKYLAAFLYRGYLILAKVKKGKTYEAKHFLPLEVFELIDITEGYLPHSVRLSLRDHNFDLAASCEAEKQLWSSALCEARDESVIPPFELPASVSPFAARPRRMSAAPKPDFEPIVEAVPLAAPQADKRHTLAAVPLSLDMAAVSLANSASAPLTSPIRPAGPHPMSGKQSSTILLRRPSASARLVVDRGLMDVFSEACAQVRSKAQLQHPLFLAERPTAQPRERLPSRDSTLMRRRKSFLDHGRSSSVDVPFNGQVRGSVIPLRHSQSTAGKKRAPRPRRNSVGNESLTEVGVSADETVTYSDFALATRMSSRNSFTDISPPSSPSRQSHGLVAAAEVTTSPTRSLGTGLGLQSPRLDRRKTASAANLQVDRPHPARSKSVPVSPSLIPKGSSAGAPHLKHASSDPIPPVPPLPFLDEGAGEGLGFISDLDSGNPGGERSKWQTIRRSMSFLRNRDSAPAASGYYTSNSNSQSRFSFSFDEPRQPQPAPPLSPTASTSYVSELGVAVSASPQHPSSASMVRQGDDGDASASGSAGASSGSAPESVPTTPKRRKSMIFRSLSRFTPM